jgi:hypothetical protein
MLANPSNPLLHKASVAAPAQTGAQPAATTEPAETDPKSDPAKNDGDEDEDEEDLPPEPPAPESDPAPEPEAAATPPARQLSAFDRTILRGLGKGDLIARVERAELESADLQSQVAKLTAENTRLAAALEAHQKETPAKIEAAAKGHANDVSKGVVSELAALGIQKEAAPSQVAADATPEAMLEKFKTLKGAEKIAFFRAHQTTLKAAEAAAK